MGTYSEKVADDYKTTIQRIQELQKIVGEEIGQFETTKKESRKSPVVTTVISHVKGISFPLEIHIHQDESREQSKLSIDNIEENVEKKSIGSASYNKLNDEDPTEDADDISIPKLVSASCVFGDNSPVFIKSSTENFSCDSGFNSSPDIKVRNDDTDKYNQSQDEATFNIFSKQPPLPPQRRNTEEKKVRDKELLESFLRNENHQKKKETMAMSKVTATGIKETLIRKTFKIRFHVKLNQEGGSSQTEKTSVLQCFLKLFKLDKIFSKK